MNDNETPLKPTCFGTRPVPPSSVYEGRKCYECQVAGDCQQLTWCNEKTKPMTSEDAPVELQNPLTRPACFGTSASNTELMEERKCSLCPVKVSCYNKTNLKRNVDAVTTSYSDRLLAVSKGLVEPGTKLDTDKLRWSLLPSGTIAQVIHVLEYGAKKYSVGNWVGVPDGNTRYYDAAMRHLDAWRGGEINDPESGLPHLAHAACCLLFLLWFDGKSVA